MMNNITHKTKNSIGERFDRLTIVDRAGSGPLKHALWKCKCDCGNEVIIPGYRLGKSAKSCGCLRRDLNTGYKSFRWNGVGDLPGSYWKQIIRNSKDRNIVVKISISEAWNQFQKQSGLCALTGLPLTFGQLINGHFRSRNGSASLDRIDNTKGYIIGNIQWIHKDINIMKKDHSMQYFMQLCKAIVEHNST